MFRSGVSIALAILVVSASLAAQSPVRTPTQYVKNDPLWFQQGSFGRMALGLDDVDGDGFPDYAVSAPAYPQGSFLGRVYIYSGRTASVIQMFDGTEALVEFGSSLADVGDVDGDGTPDLAIGSFNFDAPGGGANHGRVQVFSGATAAVLWTLDGTVGGGRLGAHLAATGTGPGPRLLIATEVGWSSPSASGAGRIVFIDPTLGAISGWAPGATTFGGLGTTLAAEPGVAGIYASNAAGDVYAIAAGIGGTGTATLAYVAPPSASNGPSLALLEGPTPGTSRVAVAYSSDDSNGLTNNGVLNLYPVGGLIPVLTLHGPFNGAFFGQRLARGRDIDGDGVDEIVTLAAGPQVTAPNEIRVFSQSGALVDEAFRNAAHNSVLTSIRDVTGDGRGEWINAIGTGSTTTFECAVYSGGLVAGTATSAVGSTLTFALDAGPLRANIPYVQGFGISGATPGISGPSPWPHVPLNFDAVTDLTLLLAGTSVLPGAIGILDVNGAGVSTLTLPMAVVTSLAASNTELTTTFVTIASGAVTFAANPVTITF